MSIFVCDYLCDKDLWRTKIVTNVSLINHHYIVAHEIFSFCILGGSPGSFSWCLQPGWISCRIRSGDEKLEAPTADIHVSSAADMTSIPGAQEGSFDLAICIYVLCNFTSKEEVLPSWVSIRYVHLNLQCNYWFSVGYLLQCTLYTCNKDMYLKRLLDAFYIFISTSIVTHIHVIQVCVRLQLAVNHKMFGANAGKKGACGHLEVA